MGGLLGVCPPLSVSLLFSFSIYPPA
uniref:Uncharacterized protein n=1 Tax=Anguilla anguilla TaxID=7936 RepID=A0A0E9VRR6_ANGAN